MDIWAVSAALRAENYVELERYFNDKQSAYEKGAIDDLSLSGFFCLTGTSRADLLPFTQAWVAAYPESYAAHHIRAELLFLVGWCARGIASSKDTAPHRLALMQQYFDEAAIHVEKALKLSEQPVLTLHIWLLIGIGGRYPEHLPDHQPHFDRLMPKNTILCRACMAYRLNPKWGGDESELERFMIWCRQQTWTTRQLAYLEADYLREQADIARCSGQLGRALTLLEQALKIDRTAGILTDLAEVHLGREEWAAAVRHLTESTQLAPNHTNYYDLGQALENIGQLDEAVAAYEKALALGNGDAAAALSWIARNLPSAQSRYKQCESWLMQGTAQYSDQAMAQRASLFITGQLGYPKDERQALTIWKEASNYGDGMSAYNLALTYWGARYGEHADYALAFNYACLAAQRNYIQVYGVIGRMHYRGHGTAVNYEQAFAYLQLAAEADDPEAMRFLIYALWFGHGTSVDRAAARQWLNHLHTLDEREYQIARREAMSLLGWLKSLFAEWRQK